MENKNYKLVNGERAEYSQLEFQEYQNRILNETKTENKINNDKLLKLKNKISQEIYVTSTVIVPILQVRKQRPRN